MRALTASSASAQNESGSRRSGTVDGHGVQVVVGQIWVGEGGDELAHSVDWGLPSSEEGEDPSDHDPDAHDAGSDEPVNEVSKPIARLSHSCFLNNYKLLTIISSY